MFTLLPVSAIHVFRILDIWNSKEMSFFLMLVIIISPKFLNGTKKMGPERPLIFCQALIRVTS
jgi:hypothetical protein